MWVFGELLGPANPGGERVVAAKRWAVVFTVLFVVLAGAAAYAAAAEIHRLQSDLGQTVQVLVAAVDIPAHTAITAAMIGTTRVPKRFWRPSLLRSADEAVGRGSQVPLKSGDLLTAPVLRQPQQSGPMRAYTFTAGSSVILEPEITVGDHIDILAAFHEKDQQYVRLLLSDVEVIRVTQDLRSRQITVLLSVEDARGVMLAENFARQVRLLRRVP